MDNGDGFFVLGFPRYTQGCGCFLSPKKELWDVVVVAGVEKGIWGKGGRYPRCEEGVWIKF